MLSIMTLSKTIKNVMLSTTTFSIKALSIMTLGIMTVRITTFNIMPQETVVLSVIYAECCK